MSNYEEVEWDTEGKYIGRDPLSPARGALHALGIVLLVGVLFWVGAYLARWFQN